MDFASTCKEDIPGLIDATHAKIASLSSQIQNLIHLRENEIKTLAKLHSMIAPIGSLPTELLVEVFLTCVERGHSNDWIKTAFMLSHVCGAWREVAHSTPQLWVNEIGVDIEREVTDLDLSQIKAWLDRSIPLSIPANLYHVARKHLRLPSTVELLNIHFSASSRWKELRWNLSTSMLSQITPGSLERLEALFIHSDWSYTGDPVVAFLECPHLRTVDLTLPQAFHLFHLPWAQLTCLHIGSSISLIACRDILLQCINLITADLNAHHLRVPSDDTQSDPPLTTLPFLEKLSIMCDVPSVIDDPFDIGLFFAPLTLPALHSFSFDLTREHEVFWNLPECMARFPNLERLTFTFCSVTPSVAVLLRSCPTVEVLNLWVCTLGPAFLHALESQPPMLPCLRQLNLGRSTFEPDLALEAVIRSRCGRLSRASGLPSTLKSKLHDCADQGLLLD